MHPTVPAATANPSGFAEKGPHDEVTRHLVASVHLKPGFANRIIRTYLGAPSGALPPAQGLDARLILTQALVARRRRRLRDALVLALMLIVALLTLPYSVSFAFAWAALWLFWSLTFGLRQALAGRGRTRPRDGEDEVSISGTATTLLYLVGAVGWAFFSVVLSWAVGSTWSGSFDVDDSSLQWSVLAPVLFFLLGAGALFVVLLLDKWVVQHVLTAHDGTKPAPSAPAPVEALSRSLTAGVTRAHSRLLDEVGRRGDDSTALVHTGWHAFVGHGDRVNAWTVPLVLRPKTQESSVRPLRPQELYQAVSTELSTMCDSDLLAPGHRLRGLTINPVIVVSDAGLRRYRETSIGQRLASAVGAPANDVAPELITELVDRDQEWVRHFQRSSVVSWDSELNVSTFLNIGCDERTLYLEWNAYCLYPVAPEYRRGDSADASGPAVVGAALFEFCQLLGSIAWRVRNLSEVSRPARSRPEQRDNSSIRELAADTRCTSEFQDLDGQRYITLLEERTFSAVRNHLTERGYSTEGLDQSSTQIINNTSNNFGNSRFLGVQQFGEASTASVFGNRSPKEEK